MIHTKDDEGVTYERQYMMLSDVMKLVQGDEKVFHDVTKDGVCLSPSFIQTVKSMGASDELLAKLAPFVDHSIIDVNALINEAMEHELKVIPGAIVSDGAASSPDQVINAVISMKLDDGLYETLGMVCHVKSGVVQIAMAIDQYREVVKARAEHQATLS